MQRGYDTLYQLFTPLCLLVITVSTGRRHAVLQLDQPWDKVSEFVFDILALLGEICQWRP